MYEQDDLEILAAVRSPIQCEGLDRGPQRMAEIAVSGAVNLQQRPPSLLDLLPVTH